MSWLRRQKAPGGRGPQQLCSASTLVPQECLKTSARRCSINTEGPVPQGSVAGFNGHFLNFPFPTSELDQSEILVEWVRRRGKQEGEWKRRDKTEAATYPKGRSCQMRPAPKGPGQGDAGSTQGHVRIPRVTRALAKPAPQSSPQSPQHVALLTTVSLGTSPSSGTEQTFHRTLLPKEPTLCHFIASL